MEKEGHRKKVSAGLLMFRRGSGGPEVFLVHPGGPFFRNKDAGAWTIPKGLAGETEPGEALLEAARREFAEETGFAIHEPLIPLGMIRQKGGKEVHAWAFEAGADAEPAHLRSNSFSMEWPPRSGRFQEFPEADRGDYFSLAGAREKMIPEQTAFLERLVEALRRQGA